MKQQNAIKRKKHGGQGAQVWRRFRKNKAAMAGLVIIAIFLLLMIFADVLYDYEGVVIKQDFSQRFQKPSWEHLCGTDDFGRDIFARIVYGTRYSLGIGFAAVGMALVLGTALGAVAGYYGKKVDMVIMRLTDIFMAVPQLLLAMIIAAVAGTEPPVIALALGIAAIPRFTRIARGATLTVCEMEYIESARALGESSPIIILRHVLPNCFASLLIQTTLSVATTILSVSGLSYLGMGVKTPIPEWGSMLSASRTYLASYTYMSIFPGIAIVLTILALNLMGDGLRDASDPKLK